MLSHKERALAVWPFPPLALPHLSAQQITPSDSSCHFLLVPKVGDSSFVFSARVATHETAEQSVRRVYGETHRFLTGADRCDLVGCNPTFAKNGRSGASRIPGFVLNCYVIVMNTVICYVL